MSRCVSQLHGDPRQQLLCVERLCHIIHRAAEQQIDFILHIDLCAQYDHRDSLELRKKLLAAQARKHQVE